MASFGHSFIDDSDDSSDRVDHDGDENMAIDIKGTDGNRGRFDLEAMQGMMTYILILRRPG